MMYFLAGLVIGGVIGFHLSARLTVWTLTNATQDKYDAFVRSIKVARMMRKVGDK